MRVEIFDAIMMSKLTNQTETNLLLKYFQHNFHILPLSQIEFVLATQEVNFFLTSTNYI